MQRIFWTSKDLTPTQYAILEDIKQRAITAEEKKDQECKELLGITDNTPQPHGYYIKLLCNRRLSKNYLPEKNDTEVDKEWKEGRMREIFDTAEAWLTDDKNVFTDNEAYRIFLEELKKYRSKGQIKSVEGMNIQLQGSLVMLEDMVESIVTKLEENNPDYYYTATERFTEGSEDYYFADFYEEVKRYKKGGRISDPDWQRVVYTGAYEFKKNLYVWHIGNLSYEELRLNSGKDSFKKLTEALADDFYNYIQGIETRGSAVQEIDSWIQDIVIDMSIKLIEWKFSYYYPVFISDKDILLCSEVISNILGNPEQNLKSQTMTTLYEIEDLIQLYAIDGIPTYNPITKEIGNVISSSLSKDRTVEWYKEHYTFSPKFKASAWYGRYTGNAWEE